jgi:hypothetical protein
MKIFVKAIGLSLAICAAPCMATTASGKVTSYWVHYFNSGFLFRIEGQPNTLACAYSVRYGVDVTSEKGRQVAAAIMSAKAAGQTVYVSGAGVCTVWGDTEDVSWISVQ